MAGVTQDILPSIEDSIKGNEPAWQLSAKERQPDSTIYRWKSGGEIVAVEVFVTASRQTASDLLQKYRLRVPVPPKEILKGLGDEALLYQSGMVFFRKFRMCLFALPEAQHRMPGDLPTILPASFQKNSCPPSIDRWEVSRE